MKFYEEKVLEAESERIGRERENLKLKEALMQAQAELRRKEKMRIKGSGTRFESSSAVY